MICASEQKKGALTSVKKPATRDFHGPNLHYNPYLYHLQRSFPDFYRLSEVKSYIHRLEGLLDSAFVQIENLGILNSRMKYLIVYPNH